MNNIITNYAGQLLMNAESKKNLIAVADKVAAYAKTCENVKFDDLLGAFTDIFDSQHEGEISVNYYYFGEGHGCYDMRETINHDIAEYVNVVFEDTCMVSELTNAIINHLKNSDIFTDIEMNSDEEGVSFFAKIVK